MSFRNGGWPSLTNHSALCCIAVWDCPFSKYTPLEEAYTPALPSGFDSQSKALAAQKGDLEWALSFYSKKQDEDHFLDLPWTSHAPITVLWLLCSYKSPCSEIFHDYCREMDLYLKMDLYLEFIWIYI